MQTFIKFVLLFIGTGINCYFKRENRNLYIYDLLTLTSSRKAKVGNVLLLYICPLTYKSNKTK